MAEDIAVVAALLVAEGLAEQSKDGEPSGLRITPKGYDKSFKAWMALSGEDRLLMALFLRKARMI